MYLEQPEIKPAPLGLPGAARAADCGRARPISTWRSLATHFSGSPLARAVDQLEQAAALDIDDAESTPRSGERWADVYGRAIGPCGARGRSGALCKLPGVGVGGRCKFHGGASTGPRTAAGKARAALNALRRRKDTMDLEPACSEADKTQPFVIEGAMPQPAAALQPEPAAPRAPRSGSPRRGILDQLLDEHLAGRRSWPVAAAILAAVDRNSRGLCRIELEQELGDQRLGAIVNRLVARGVLTEALRGRRLVLLRSGR